MCFHIWSPLSTFLSGNCLTVGGAKEGMKCMFPFTYKGVTHNACTDHGNDDPEWVPWCSTKVDDYGGHVGGNWGDCSQECPFELSKDFHLQSSRGGLARGHTHSLYSLFKRPFYLIVI